MSKYEQLRDALERKLGDRLPARLEFARLYWGPRNYSRHDLKKELDVELLFDEWIKIETGRNRWLLSFHDEISDMSDPNEVMEAILHCKNWKRYAEIWKRRAPRHIRSPWIMLYAVVDMTTQGGRTENNYEDDMKKKGHTVERASSADDARGIDFWVDGKPVQVKSAKTKAGAKRYGVGEDWA